MALTVVDALRTALATHLNQQAAAAEITHVHTSLCPTPCPNTGKVYSYGAVDIPSDHILLDDVALPNGGRIIHDMAVSDIATMLGAAVLPLTYATACVALTAYETVHGGSTGLRPYLDQWHTEGIL